MIVYGARAGSNQRVIAAVDSIAHFCRITGISRWQATTYGSPTGNEAEIMTARARFGVALYRPAMASAEAPFKTETGEIVSSWSAITSVTVTLTMAQIDRILMSSPDREIETILRAGKQAARHATDPDREAAQ